MKKLIVIFMIVIFARPVLDPLLVVLERPLSANTFAL